MPPRIAVDIGNTRIKLGLFDEQDSSQKSNKCSLPSPDRVLTIPAIGWDESVLSRWLIAVPREIPCWIASVNRPASARLIDVVEPVRPVRHITHADLPVTTSVDRPDYVGVDRLAGAVAVNRLRNPSRPAVVVHVGSAITCNLVDAGGIFRGGAILPGLAMSARALHDFTDMLPHVPLDEPPAAPPSVGNTTISAIQSGLYWGAVGAIREMISQFSKSIGASDAKSEVFLTGGAAPAVAGQLDPSVRYVEHLVLAGIALANP